MKLDIKTSKRTLDELVEDLGIKASMYGFCLNWNQPVNEIMNRLNGKGISFSTNQDSAGIDINVDLDLGF